MERPLRRRAGSRFAAVALVGAAAVALAACSSSSGGSSVPPAAPSSAGSTSSGSADTGTAALQSDVNAMLAKPTSINQKTPLPGPAPSGKSVVYISNGLAATERIGVGVHEAAIALKWQYSELSFDSANPATLQSALMNALAKKPSAVVVTANPQTQFGTSTIAAYQAAHIPLVLGSIAPVTLGAPIYGTPAGATSEQSVGKALADWFIADSNGQGSAILENYTSAPVLNVFRDAFLAEVKAQCASCATKVVSVTQSDVASGGLIPKVIAAARQNPSDKYLFFDNGQFADGILAALSSAGISGMKIGGRSIDPYGASALAAGTEQVWTGQSYYLEGEGLVDAALRIIETGKNTSGDDVIPLQLLTKANVGELNGGQFNEPSDSLEQYEKLWQVPVTACKLTCS
jgi:ribose transport system substrate-binding protein